MMTPTSRHKYQLPELQRDHVHRPRLLGLLDMAAPCALVSAPAGFGKSSLVASWARTQQTPIVWVNLEEGVNSLDAFFLYLVEPLGPYAPEMVAKSRRYFSKSEKPSEEELMVFCLESMEAIDSRVTLVLDDYHRVSDAAIHQLITIIIEKRLLHKVVLITRYDPALPIVVWRQHGLVSELRASDLRFEVEEVSSLLEGTGSEQFAKRLIEGVDGWIAGIRLLTFGLRNEADLTAKLQQFEKEGRGDFAAMVRWYLKMLEPRQREAVQALSCFATFSADLLAYLDFADAEVVLRGITASKLLIVSLDDHEGWFRFHHLFHEHLLEITREDLSESQMARYRVAGAEYFERQGEHGLALKYLLEARHFEKAVTVFAKARKGLIDNRQWVALETVTNSMDKAGIEHVLLDLTRCWLHIREGRSGELFELLAQIAAKLNENDSDRILLAEYKALLSYRTYNIEQDFGRCITDCEYALAHLGNEWSYPKGLPWIFLLGSLQASGRLEEVERRASEAIRSHVSSFERGSIWFVLCYVYWLEADLAKLKATSEALIELGTDVQNDELIGQGHFFLILQRYHTGDWQGAWQLAIQNESLVDKGIGIVRLFYRLTKASVLHKMGREADWRDLLDTTLKEVYKQRNKMLPPYIKAKAAELEMLSGNTSKAVIVMEELGHLPYFPVTNDVDPNLCRINIFLASEDPASWQRAKKSIDEFRPSLTSHHNRMALTRLNIYEAIYWHRQRDEEQASACLSEAIAASVASGLLGPFFESNRVLIDLLQGMGDKFPYRAEGEKLLRLLSSDPTKPSVSRREREILDLMSRKLSNKEIAAELHIAEKTVKNHSHRLFKKLGVKNRREAILKVGDLR